MKLYAAVLLCVILAYSAEAKNATLHLLSDAVDTVSSYKLAVISGPIILQYKDRGPVSHTKYTVSP